MAIHCHLPTICFDFSWSQLVKRSQSVPTVTETRKVQCSSATPVVRTKRDWGGLSINDVPDLLTTPSPSLENIHKRCPIFLSHIWPPNPPIMSDFYLLMSNFLVSFKTLPGGHHLCMFPYVITSFTNFPQFLSPSPSGDVIYGRPQRKILLLLVPLLLLLLVVHCN